MGGGVGSVLCPQTYIWFNETMECKENCVLGNCILENYVVEFLVRLLDVYSVYFL